MKPVTDLELLRMLNSGGAPTEPSTLKPVTDPTLLRMLNEGKSAERERGRSLPTGFKGTNAALQGATFGFGDELQGAIAAGGALVANALPDSLTPRVLEPLVGRSPGEAYRMMRDAARGAQDQFRKDAPFTSTGLEVAGSLTTGGALANLGRAAITGVAPAPVATFLATRGPVMTAAGIGGLTGAVGGAGDAETLGDVPMGALTGGALGAASGAGTQAALGAAGSVVNNVRARVAPADTGGIGGRVRSMIAGGTADDLARQRVAQALARDERSAERVARRLDTLGADAPLAVGAGRNTVDLLDTMATMPGRTGDRVERAIRTQQAGRADRIIEGAGGLAGGRQMTTEVAELTRQQADNAGPIYNAIRDIPVAADDRLQRILRRPVVQEALAQARVAAANADEVLPDIKAGEPARMAVWDQIKRGLDDVIGLKKRGVDAGTAGNAAKSTLSDAVRTKQELLAVLDELVPDYKLARDAFSGPAALKDAIDEGRSLFTTKPVDLRETLAGLSASERDAFRIGAAQALRERVGTESGQTSLLKFWKEPATRERLQAVFPDERSYRQFVASMLGEGQRKTLEGVGRGSQTAARQARQDDEAAAFLQGAVDAGAALKTANPASIISTVRNLYGRTTMPEPVRDRIGSLLLTRGPEAQTELRTIADLVRQTQARDAERATRSGVAGATALRDLLIQ